MSLLLDTNVVSELRKGDRADPRVRAWAAAAPADQFNLSVISVLEIEQGILLIERRDPAQAAVLRAWARERILAGFAGRLLPVDTAVALRCAGLHVPDPRSERDALIAATALVHGLTVVTRNAPDFAVEGLRVLNPWGEEANPAD